MLMDLFARWQATFNRYQDNKTPENDAAERAAWLEYILALQGPGPCEPMRLYDRDDVVASIEANKDSEESGGAVPRIVSGPAKKRETFTR